MFQQIASSTYDIVTFSKNVNFIVGFVFAFFLFVLMRETRPTERCFSKAGRLNRGLTHTEPPNSWSRLCLGETFFPFVCFVWFFLHIFHGCLFCVLVNSLICLAESTAHTIIQSINQCLLIKQPNLIFQWVKSFSVATLHYDPRCILILVAS